MSVDYGEKKRPARERVLGLMADAAWHTWHELETVGGVRYGARLLELRRLGYDVQSESLDDGSGNRYRIPTLEIGAPQQKRVNVLLTEDDAREFVRGRVTMFAQRAVRDALASFEHNKEKL